MANEVDVSVVIGFKDWGTLRLATAVDSILEAFGSLRGEVIVSDYGSAEFEEARAVLESRGAVYVRTETDGKWSRSRALNAGFAVARGDVLVSTDADMIFTPRSFESIGNRILAEPRLSLVLQCRDLPEGYSDVELATGGIDWQDLANVSRLRPRWGMGGMMAVSRHSYNLVRGLDERMEIYGGEDIDFAHRLRRSGSRLEWVTDPDIRMYHMWHPPTRQIVAETADGRKAIALNSQIHTSDTTIVRNSVNWKHRPSRVSPLISVVISTHNRAKFLAESINSVLNQTLQDFEVVIVDDGSDDDTRTVVESFSDTRIRYYYQEQQGIAAARNFAATVSRGRYTAVHDDDDLMLPWRLEAQIESITPGIHGSYGGWVDFNDETGELMPNYGKGLSLGSLLHSGKVYLHPTLMVETFIIRQLGYDPSLRSGSDYNLGMRMMRTGFKLAHSGRLHTLRRLHPGQITALDPVVQRTSAILSSFVARTPISTAERTALHNANRTVPNVPVAEHSNIRDAVWAYLPDKLVARDIIVNVADFDATEDLGTIAAAFAYLIVEENPGAEGKKVWGVQRGATWADMVKLRQVGIEYDCIASTEQLTGVPGKADGWLSRLLAGLSSDRLAAPSKGQTVVVPLDRWEEFRGTEAGNAKDHLARFIELHSDGVVARYAVTEFADMREALAFNAHVGGPGSSHHPLIVSSSSSVSHVSDQLEKAILNGVSK